MDLQLLFYYGFDTASQMKLNTTRAQQISTIAPDEISTPQSLIYKIHKPIKTTPIARLVTILSNELSSSNLKNHNDNQYPGR